MHSNFRYDSEKLCIAKFTVPASCNLLLAIFLQFSSCFEILHSWLAEIDMRPYEIDGNQADFGYDWIDTIIWPPIPAKTTKIASECNQKCNRDPNMSIGLIIIISTQKALKTY